MPSLVCSDTSRLYKESNDGTSSKPNRKRTINLASLQAQVKKVRTQDRTTAKASKISTTEPQDTTRPNIPNACAKASIRAQQNVPQTAQSKQTTSTQTQQQADVTRGNRRRGRCQSTASIGGRGKGVSRLKGYESYVNMNS